MNLNEGIVGSDTKIEMKSEMLRQIDSLKETTPDEWERAVFESLTGHKREDVDWDIPDNHAGYYTWIRSFDQLIGELEEEGYVKVTEQNGNRKTIKKTEWDPAINPSQLIYSGNRPG